MKKYSVVFLIVATLIFSFIYYYESGWMVNNVNVKNIIYIDALWYSTGIQTLLGNTDVQPRSSIIKTTSIIQVLITLIILYVVFIYY